jgi:hypothetical protein
MTMYAARRTYTRMLIEPAAVWHNFAEPDVMEPPPPPPYPATAPTVNAKAVFGRAEPATMRSAVYIHDDRDRVKARFRLLRRLPADHDNEGAAAAQPDSVDAAIAFIDQMRDYPAPFYATLDDDGSAVIEFENRGTGFFADLTFRGKDAVVCYVRQPNSPSRIIEGQLNSRSIQNFLSSEMQVIL